MGVQWVLRDSPDPLAPEIKPVVQTQTVAAASATGTAPRMVPEVAAVVRRGPMATRLRRQQAAAAAVVPASSGTLPDAQAPAASLKPAPLKPASRVVPHFAKPTQLQSHNRPVQADPQIAAELKTARWEDIKALCDRCHVCTMARERTHTVVADGAPGCPIVMVGEAPGREEDLAGIPFVGNSGKLLTEILKACDLVRGRDVAICNVLKCRPPGNRDPRPDEVAACAAFLDRQLELLQPKLLVLMGKHAVFRLLGETRPISQMRGRLYEVQIAGRAVPAVVTYHPSYLLRNPVAKELGWHDILFARKSVPAQ